ncbi:MAG TPA: type II toxin-antitoxin system PemK/MazF family toxin [Candidatus Hydrogenedentes bacterium]|nr:type II toxin-antitoxin system PemK/MazF family toxin [Candidatus Hydrogenedentota bacterium]
MVIRQGEVYWVNLGAPRGSAPGYRHPHVVVQNNLFNASRIATIVVCPLTSKLRYANAPGNVLLNKGEGQLPKASVVNVSQVFTVDKSDIEEKIGALSDKRIKQILDGVALVLQPRELDA